MSTGLAMLLDLMAVGKTRPTQGACREAAARIRELEGAAAGLLGALTEIATCTPSGRNSLVLRAQEAIDAHEKMSGQPTPRSCDRCWARAEVVALETRVFGSHLCERVSMRAWHTEACARQLEDPGASCSCRPPRGDDIAISFGRGGA